jgi:hypothetical protein
MGFEGMNDLVWGGFDYGVEDFLWDFGTRTDLILIWSV